MRLVILSASLMRCLIALSSTLLPSRRVTRIAVVVIVVVVVVEAAVVAVKVEELRSTGKHDHLHELLIQLSSC